MQTGGCLCLKFPWIELSVNITERHRFFSVWVKVPLTVSRPLMLSDCTQSSREFFMWNWPMARGKEETAVTDSTPSLWPGLKGDAPYRSLEWLRKQVYHWWVFKQHFVIVIFHEQWALVVYVWTCLSRFLRLRKTWNKLLKWINFTWKSW